MRYSQSSPVQGLSTGTPAKSSSGCALRSDLDVSYGTALTLRAEFEIAQGRLRQQGMKAAFRPERGQQLGELARRHDDDGILARNGNPLRALLTCSMHQLAQMRLGLVQLPLAVAVELPPLRLLRPSLPSIVLKLPSQQFRPA